jgi:hypothetical protein
MQVVVGLCGPAGSGKSTVADYLARTYGARPFALAEPLKVLIQRAFDVPRAYLYGTQAQKEAVIPGLGLSGRYLMQRIGTNGMRSVFGDDFWVKHTMNEIEDHAVGLAVIEDVRFLSEASYIRDWCDVPRTQTPCYIWKLAHPWLEATADPSHQSEAEWQRVQEDHRISTPDKSLGALYLEVDRACSKFGIPPVRYSIEAP